MESAMPSKIDCLCDENARLKEEIVMLRKAPQIPESAVKAVWEHGAKCGIGAQWEDYSHHVGALFVEELKGCK